MAARADNFDPGTVHSNVVVLTHEGAKAQDILHPTGAMMAALERVREEARASLEANGTVRGEAFLLLAFADAFVATREVLRRIVDGEDSAHGLAEAWLTLGFDAADAEYTVEALRLDVSDTLDEALDGAVSVPADPTPADIAEHFRVLARKDIDAGNVERGWWQHGLADRAEGLPVDLGQAHDPYYGVYYSRGFHGHPYEG